jgi:hypothetical protein
MFSVFQLKVLDEKENNTESILKLLSCLTKLATINCQKISNVLGINKILYEQFQKLSSLLLVVSLFAPTLLLSHSVFQVFVNYVTRSQPLFQNVFFFCVYCGGSSATRKHHSHNNNTQSRSLSFCINFFK